VKVGDDIWDFYFVSGIDIDNDGDTIVVTAIDQDFDPFITIFELVGSTWTKKSGLDSDDLCDQICALPMSVSYSDNANYMAFSLSLLGLEWISVIMTFDESTNTWSTVADPIAEFSCPSFNTTTFVSDCYLFSPSKVAVSNEGDTVASGHVIRQGAITHEAFQIRHLVNGDDWQLRHNVTYSGTSPSYMGFFVDLSRDGETAIVGAPLYQTYTGALAVFKYDSDSQEWNEVFDLEGSQDEKDILGWSIMLSGDGKTFVVGIPGAGDLDGSAKVYSIDCRMTTSRAGRVYNIFNRESVMSKFYFPLRKY